MTSRSELVLQVALALVQASDVELPRPCEIVSRQPRTRRDAQYRIEQLQEAAEAFEIMNYRKPKQIELARMTGMCRSSVNKLLRTGKNW